MAFILSVDSLEPKSKLAVLDRAHRRLPTTSGQASAVALEFSGKALVGRDEDADRDGGIRRQLFAGSEEHLDGNNIESDTKDRFLSLPRMAHRGSTESHRDHREAEHTQTRSLREKRDMIRVRTCLWWLLLALGRVYHQLRRGRRVLPRILH